MTLQKDLSELDKVLGELKAKTIDKFGAWYVKFFGRFAFPLYCILLTISVLYVVVSICLTIKQP